MKPLKDEVGYWWVPEDPARRYPGRLSYDPEDGACLEISFEQGQPALNPSDKEYALIYGVTSGGRDITLVNCYLTHGRWSTGGISTSTIFGHFALDGFHLPSVEETNIRSISATVKFLWRWLGTTGIKITHSDNFQDFDITYRQHPPLIIKISPSMDLEILVRPATIPYGGGLISEVNIREQILVRLKAHPPQSYRSLLDALHVVFDFFTFACMDFCAADDITLEGDFQPRTLANGATIYPTAHFYYMPVFGQANRRPSRPMDVLLKNSDLTAHLEPVLTRWFEIASHLKSVRVLYLSALYGDHPYVENKFLAMCQATEVFHRRFRRGEYMDQEKYDSEVLPLLISRIPTDLTPDLWETMRQRFEHLNEFSLGKRLKELLKENKDIIIQFIPDFKAVLRDIVEARNQFTHFSPKQGYREINGEALLYYVDVLRLIVDLAILGEVGVPREILQKAALGSEVYRRKFVSKPR